MLQDGNLTYPNSENETTQYRTQAEYQQVLVCIVYENHPGSYILNGYLSSTGVSACLICLIILVLFVCLFCPEPEGCHAYSSI